MQNHYKDYEIMKDNWVGNAILIQFVDTISDCLVLWYRFEQEFSIPLNVQLWLLLLLF